jgi:hypothetical protein
MNSIKRIIVTGDFLRQRKTQAGVSSQDGNINWLYHMIRPSLGLLCDLPIVSLTYDGGRDGLASEIYATNGMKPCFESWVELYGKKPSRKELALIYGKFAGSLVIAFELPEIIRTAFDILEIPYVDITIHPVRFMDDLLFGIRSNIATAIEAMSEFIVFDDEIRVSGGLAMATLVRLPRLEVCAGDNVALFAGQTTDDKVLIKNGRLLDVDDFIPRLQELCANHEKVLVKPHPMAANNDFILALTRLFKNTFIVKDNFYHLLSHDQISTVYSLTSSTSIEAAHLYKRGFHLSEYPYFFCEHSCSGGAFLSVRPEMYLPKFWSGILNLLGIETGEVNSIGIGAVPNRMRMSLRSYWGADIFSRI